MSVGGASVPRPLQTYDEALSWLYSLQRFGIKLGLENAERLMAAVPLDLPQTRVVHVAGTNGKGSVCAMVDAICRAAGYRTGLFTSPHLVSFPERIRVNGEMMSHAAVADGLTQLRKRVADWDSHPTFFELATALALQHFARAECDVIVLETGMGGRLDATNVVPSNVAVITPIGLDHQSWLGQTVREIATEKAGIIKANTPVISARQVPEAADVIRARAGECHAPLTCVEKLYEASPIALRGAHQKENAAVAVAAVRAAGISVEEKDVVRGLAAVEWPARFQCWDERIIVDGAHNPAAAAVLAQTWREIFGEQRATVILAVLSDKDAGAICQALAPVSEFVILPAIRSARALPPDDLAQALSSITPKLPYSITPSVADALAAARARPNPVLITGSLHFAGEALAHLRGEPAAFEECAQ